MPHQVSINLISARSIFAFALFLATCSARAEDPAGLVDDAEETQVEEPGDTKYPVPNLEKAPIQLLPHQQFPIDYLLKHDDVKGLIVNHYMGTGKTYLGIGFAEHFKKQSVVILAPRFIEAHWMEHVRNFPARDPKRYQFVSYNDAPKLLMGKDLTNTVLIMDEVHNLIKLIKSADPDTNRKYSDLYEHLRSSHKILALSGTPIYNDEYDLAYLMNLVSGKNIMPFNEEQFRVEYTDIRRVRSFWRGYVFESNILKFGLPGTALLLALPVGLMVSPVLILPVGLALMLGTTLVFPVVDNLIAPVETFQLRELNVKKFEPFVSKYVSFYEIENQDLSEFPTKTIKVQDVSYNAEQFWFFLNFAEKSLGNKGLARLYKDVDANFDPAYLTLNSTILQNRMANSAGSGREIGNLEFEGETEGSIIEPPKFVEVLKQIKSDGMPKAVVYSNYYENGIVAFSKFLDRNGLAGSYEILRPDIPPQQFAAAVQRYNEGKIKILLLHPEITEGISLKGTRQFHVLEPVINLTVLNQVIARAVRYQSHNMLPASERHVDVYIWKAVIGSLSWKTLKLQKANWFTRYSEMSDWSNWGQGIAQIDKNYDRKKLSPDAQAYMQLESVNDNMEALKQIMKANSIEKRAAR